MIDGEKAGVPPPTDDHQRVLLGNAVQRVGKALFGSAWDGSTEGSRWDEAVDFVGRSLRQGRLEAYLPWMTLLAIMPDDWRLSPDDLAAICLTSQSTIAPTLGMGGSRDWVFVGSRGLDALVFSITGPASGRSAPFKFRMEEKNWRLFDAAIWIATGGNPTTTAAIAKGSLEEVGCRLLFPKLAEMGYSGPKITGLGFGEMRTWIMSDVWERAHTGWLGPGVGHLVRFFPDPDGADGVSCDLTMNRSCSAGWWDLRIQKDDLLTLFPRIEPGEGDAEAEEGGQRNPRQSEFEMMLALIDGENKETAKNAARIVASETGKPESTDALYAAFRRAHPDKVRAYHRG